MDISRTAGLVSSDLQTGARMGAEAAVLRRVRAKIVDSMGIPLPEEMEGLVDAIVVPSLLRTVGDMATPRRPELGRQCHRLARSGTQIAAANGAASVLDNVLKLIEQELANLGASETNAD